MKRRYLLSTFLLCTLLAVFSGSVYAELDQPGTTHSVASTTAIKSKTYLGTDEQNYGEYIGYNGVADHSIYSYYMDGQQAWCVECGVAIPKGATTYNVSQSDDETSKVMSYVMKYRDFYDESVSPQVIQVAMWKLSGYASEKDTSSKTPDGSTTYFQVVNDQAQMIIDEGREYINGGNGSQKASGGSFSVGSLNFNYDQSLDAYVSQYFNISASGAGTTVTLDAVSGAYIERGSSKEYSPFSIGGGATETVRVCVPASVSTQNIMTIGVSASGGGSGISYDGCYKYLNTQYQDLARPAYHEISGSGASISGQYEPLGSISVAKREKNTGNGYNDLIGGAKFIITGPDNFYQEWTSVAGQTKLFENIRTGEYKVVEVDAPTNMYIGTAFINVTVLPGRTVEVIYENEYQRGSVSLIKYNAVTGGAGVPNEYMTLAGAVYELHAAEKIMEGNHTCYEENQLVRGNIVTKEDGSTDSVGDLPIGRYYYIEVSPSEGFVLSTDKVYVNVSENNHSTAQAVNDSNRAPEDEVDVGIKIIKTLSETDYDPELNLANCRFSVSLIKKDGTVTTDSTQIFYTTYTDEDGIATVDKIPYGKYRVHEIDCPPEALPVADFDVDFTKDGGAFDGKEYSYELEDKSKTIQIDIEKAYYKDLIQNGQVITDAELAGAEFSVYLDPECTEPYKDKNGNHVKLVTEKVSNTKASVVSGTMRTGDYYLKETKFPKGMNPEAVNPNAESKGNPKGTKYKDMVYAIYADNTVQTVENEVKKLEVNNMSKTSKVLMVKFDDNKEGTEELPAVGAKVRLVLESNPNVYYECTIDEYGTTEFVNSKILNLEYDVDPTNPCSIPYGTYKICEQKESDKGEGLDWFFQKLEIQVFEDGKTYLSHHSENDVEVALRVEKYDKDTNKKVYLAGAKYRVWDCQKNDFITQKLHDGSHEDITVFETKENGELILPDPISAGDYIIYEIEAPEGYYLDNKYRLPMDKDGNVIQSKLGKAEYGGLKITINKEVLEVAKDKEYPTNPKDRLQYILDNLVFVAKIPNTPLKGKIKLYKTGEMYTGVNDTEYDVNGEKYNAKYPTYSEKGLNGVTFKITATNDIYSSDGKELYREKGWSTTMTTGANGTEEGLAVSEELYNGEYLVEEIVTPVGYEACEPFTVVVDNKNPLEKVKILNKEKDNKYQPAQITFTKIFKEIGKDGAPIYKAGNEEEIKHYAIFGLYNKEDLTTQNGKYKIPADTLMQVIKVVDGEEAKTTMKLPDGEYYLTEMYATAPYGATEDVFDITIDHRNATNKDSILYVTGPEIINWPETSDLFVVKVSKSDVLQEFGITLKTDNKENTLVNDFLEVYSAQKTNQILTGELDIDEVLAEALRQFDIMTSFTLTTPAKYGVYIDEECKTPLECSYDSGATYEDVYLNPVIDKDTGRYSGAYSVIGIPEGVYYIKELKAPKYMDNKGIVREYEVYPEPIEIMVSNSVNPMFTDNEENIIFRVFSDSTPAYQIQKTDIFTSEVVPECLFTITDKNGKELLRFVTNEEGLADIPTDIFEDGEKYYFTEISAPKFPYYDGDELYELNTKPHEFVAHVTEYGKWTMEDVDEEGNKITHGKVEIKNYRVKTNVEFQKLDMMDSTPIPNCKFRLESKETNFAVEGVTDENGIYIFKDIEYGEYTYTEIEAPEGYIIDTTPHEFTLDSKGTKIVVYNEKMIDTPDTGDIAVIAIVCIAVVCVAGIVFVIIKNKKVSK